MKICKHHIKEPDGLGKCQKIIDYQFKGASTAAIEKVIRNNLNGGYKVGNKYLFNPDNCNEDKDCTAYE